MPKRVIDFDAMWGSDKLAACAAWAQGEYAWLYGLADASGCFELTNLRVIWGRVAAIRGNFTIERLERVFAEFQEKGLLFVWEHEGKRYAHWTGSDVPGRLPPPSWRMRLERFTPPVPKQQLAAYMARFARGRAALGGVGFRGEAQRESANQKEDCRFEISDLKDERWRGGRAQSSQMTEQRLLVTDRGDDCGYRNSNLQENGETGERGGNSRSGERRASAAIGGRDGAVYERRDIARGSGLKGRVEGTQAQDLDLDGNLDGNWGMGRDERQGGPGDAQVCSRDVNREKDLTGTDFCNSNSKVNSSAQSNANPNASSPFDAHPDLNATQRADLNSPSCARARMDSQSQSRSSSGGSSRASTAGRGPEGAPDGKDVSRGEVRAGSETVRGAASFAWRDKDLAVARELRVGQGPVCGPVRVRPEVLERVRRREAARAGSRSP
jgi:hypothetical protein